MRAPRALALLASVALLAGPLAGCLSFFKDEEPVVTVDDEQKKAEEILGEEGQQVLEDLASSTPKNYTFPLQKRLPVATHTIEGSVGPESDLSHEGNQDQGGIEYNTIVITEDISSFIPEGQPVEVFVKLQWNAKEFKSVDYDIYVDLPGAKTSYYPAKSEEMNWNVPTKTLTVNTIGVKGANHLVGVQAASGRTTEAVPYTITLEFTYPKDVLTAAVPWAIQVPANASGLIFESEKVAGDEHITSEFLVIGPDDELVGYVEFNDLAIPTESVFVPTKGPGEYVFWAFYMHGGFLSVRADAPLESLEARPLALSTTTTTLGSSPSPGLVERDFGYRTAAEGALVTPLTGQQSGTVDLQGTHPLGVTAYIAGPGTLGTQVRITSPKGVVHDVQRVLHYEDERGSIAYTSDEGYDNRITYANVVKGAYTIDYVNNGPTEVGYTVLTYQR